MGEQRNCLSEISHFQINDVKMEISPWPAVWFHDTPTAVFCLHDLGLLSWPLLWILFLSMHYHYQIPFQRFVPHILFQYSQSFNGNNWIINGAQKKSQQKMSQGNVHTERMCWLCLVLQNSFPPPPCFAPTGRHTRPRCAHAGQILLWPERVRPRCLLFEGVLQSEGLLPLHVFTLPGNRQASIPTWITFSHCWAERVPFCCCCCCCSLVRKRRMMRRSTAWVRTT